MEVGLGSTDRCTSIVAGNTGSRGGSLVGSAGLGASCGRICAGADLAVLGPVLSTPTHPGAAGLGWTRFAALLKDCPLPVYALGGLRPADLEMAWRHGAHGISMMRGAWS